MAGCEALEVPYAGTLKDKIEASVWASTAFGTVPLKEPFRTPSPFRLSRLLTLFIAVFVVWIVIFSAMRTDFAEGFGWGLLAGAVAELAWTTLRGPSKEAVYRATEIFFMQVNGGVWPKDFSGTATFTSAGVRLSGTEFEGVLPWSQLSAFLDRSDDMMLVFRNGWALPFPKASLSADQCRNVSGFVARNAPGIGALPTPPRDIVSEVWGRAA